MCANTHKHMYNIYTYFIDVSSIEKLTIWLFRTVNEDGYDERIR